MPPITISISCPRGATSLGRTRWPGCVTAIATAADASHDIEPSFRSDSLPPHAGAQERAAPLHDRKSVLDFGKSPTGYTPGHDAVDRLARQRTFVYGVKP